MNLDLLAINRTEKHSTQNKINLFFEIWGALTGMCNQMVTSEIIP